MAITTEQVKDIEQLRASVHALIDKGIGDEYLLATYNGIVRRLDERLPKIRQRAESRSLKEESREKTRKAREALGRKSAPTSNRPQSSAQRTA